MSYWEAKAARHRALVALVHGADEAELETGPADFDAGVRTDFTPRGERQPLPPSGEPREVGWGHEVELENGAELFCPWLAER